MTGPIYHTRDQGISLAYQGVRQCRSMGTYIYNPESGTEFVDTLGHHYYGFKETTVDPTRVGKHGLIIVQPKILSAALRHFGRVVTCLIGENNELLPFDEVRRN
jgi:hypothetical protein